MRKNALLYRNWHTKAYETAVEAAALMCKNTALLRKQARWDREHIRTASTRLELKDAARLREACEAAGCSVYQLLRYMILTFLAAWDADQRKERYERNT